MNFVS